MGGGKKKGILENNILPNIQIHECKTKEKKDKKLQRTDKNW